VVVMVMAVLSSRYQLAAAVRATHPADALRSINLHLAAPLAGGGRRRTGPREAAGARRESCMGQFAGNLSCKEVIAILILRAEKRSAMVAASRGGRAWLPGRLLRACKWEGARSAQSSGGAGAAVAPKPNGCTHQIQSPTPSHSNLNLNLHMTTNCDNAYYCALPRSRAPA
jgi:hypothetical protein